MEIKTLEIFLGRFAKVCMKLMRFKLRWPHTAIATIAGESQEHSHFVNLEVTTNTNFDIVSSKWRSHDGRKESVRLPSRSPWSHGGCNSRKAATIIALDGRTSYNGLYRVLRGHIGDRLVV